ncbi:hypothetical protein MKW98_028841 [Papaver atlanticum]|uniref:MADS-box domain-containing protein n=1 Tax=Papaver atlanticum TaxID=357466 RepID=A0AAD4S2H3_9MAGN|nr:hypothetical protein MKW98_028841 [Papaver atlanticum]
MVMNKKDRKPSQGRKKIPIQKIESESNRQVTFSKRRNGLFKKVCELCVLCGAEVAVVAFSPAGKAYSFGNPHVDSTISRFLNSQGNSHINNLQLAVRPADIHRHGFSAHEQQQEQYMKVAHHLDVEKKRGALVEKLKRINTATTTSNDGNKFWWEIPNDGIEKTVAKRIEDLVINGAVSSTSPVMMPTLHLNVKPIGMNLYAAGDTGQTAKCSTATSTTTAIVPFDNYNH